MEPITLATTVINLVAPYLAQAGEVMAKKAGQAAWDRVERLLAAVKSKLAGDSYAEQSMARLEENPQSAGRQSVLAGVLEEKIQDDPAFAQALKKLLTDAKEAGAETMIQQVTVSGHAQAGDINLIGKVEGGVNLGKSSMPVGRKK